MTRLVVLSGLPGVGKTSIAVGVARLIGAVHLSVDPVEDAMLGAGLDRGWTTGVAAYEAVRAAAGLNLGIGRDVVVDAVNDSAAARGTWSRAARHTDATLVLVHLVCSDPTVHRSRVETRTRGMSHVGEPTWDDVLARAAAYEPWDDGVVRIDTSAHDLDACVRAVVAQLETSR